MTDSPISPDLLPPIAWQRGADWGRDVTAYARNQDERINDPGFVDALQKTTGSTVEAIVLTSRYRRVLGGKLTPSQFKRNLLEQKDARDIYSGRLHETDIASCVTGFVMGGSRVIALGPQLVAQAEADDSADLSVEALSKGGPDFYVHLEGTTTITYGGKPLDGFLVGFEDDEEIDEEDPAEGGASEISDDAKDETSEARLTRNARRHLHILPMARENDPLTAPHTPQPSMCLEPSADDRTISDTIRRAARDMIKRMERNNARNIAENEKFEADVLANPPKNEAEAAKIEGKRKRNIALDLIADAEGEQILRQVEIATSEADKWARLIGTALRCLVNQGPVGLPAFPAEAPSDQVEKAFRKGTGARKAERRLIADGYPKMTRYEIGQVAPEDSDPNSDDGEATAVQPDGNPADAQAEATTTPIGDDQNDDVGGVARRSRRKDRRLLRLQQRQTWAQAENEAEPDPDSETMEPCADEAADIQPDTGGEEPTATHRPQPANEIGEAQARPIHSDALRDELEDTLRRCFRDLPSITTRNWDTSFPPALAAMVMRRAKVAQLPRENIDATRRRLTADILPRMDGLPGLLTQLRGVEARHGDRIRAYRVTRASILRDIDPDVSEMALHPILVSVTDDDDLARRIAFPGVERDLRYDQNRTVIVRAWRVERTLHLMGVVHDGCLVGFRRLEHGLDTGETRVFDGEADDGDAAALLDALYAPVADAVLGPVDELDAWRYHRRHAASERTRRTGGAAPLEGPRKPHAVTASSMPIPLDVKWTVQPDDFTSWENVSRPTPPLGGETHAAARDLMDRNAVARAVFWTLETQTEDGPATDVRNALTRHMASAAAFDTRRVDAMTAPDIDDDADLTGCQDADGVLVITDRALFEHASPGIVAVETASRETPLCIVYRLRQDGVSAIVMQPTADNEVNLAQWTRFALTPKDDDSDLAWYLRGAMASVLKARPSEDPGDAVSTQMPVLTSRARRAPSSMDDAPRRIVAQARLRPRDARVAVETASNWFDAQAVRHGPSLVEDSRNDGEWTIEHESEDRGVRSRWSVTLRPADEPGALDIVVRSTLATGVKPRLPTLVREIAAATPTDGPDGRLLLTPPWVKTRSDFNDLIRHLQSPDRQLPTLVMTQDQYGQYARDPIDVARQSLGAMNVWLIAEQLTYDLTGALGQEYRTFGGAMRLFQPRFDPDVDPATRHPRIMNDAGVERAVAELISRATAATTTRYNIPDSLAPAPAPSPSALAPSMADALDMRAADRRVETVEQKGDADNERIDAPIETQEADALESAPMEAPSANEEPPVTPAAGVDEAHIGSGRQPDEAARQPHVQKPADDVTASDHEPGGPLPVQRTVPRRRVAATRPDADNALDKRTPAEPVAATAEAEPQPPVAADMAALLSALDERISRRLDDAGVTTIQATLSTLVERIETIGDRIMGITADADIEARDQEIRRLREEMRIERESALELLGEAEAQRQAAVDEVETLRQAFNDKRRGAIRKEAATRWPSELSGLAEWLEHNVLPNVAIAPKAWRAMRRIRYTDMERLCKTLQLLDGAYIDMRAGEEGARALWETGLKELRLENRKQGDMGKSIREGAEYRFEYQGVRLEMDHHLRGKESLFNETDRLLRIYYTYDKQRGRVIIGHLPTHLTTVDS